MIIWIYHNAKYMRWYLDTLNVARTIIDALEDKKGENILLLDIQEQAVFADYFIICTGTSDRMLKALGESVEEQVRKKYDMKARYEGVADDGWVLLDYGDIIVHLFSPNRRDYYQLEELWSDGKVLVHLQ